MSEIIRYARRLAIKVKPDQIDNFLATMKGKVFPNMKSQKGIRRMYLLQAPMQNEFVSLTLWDNKSYADAYGTSGSYTQNVDSAREFLESDPTLTEFDVVLHDVNGEDLPPPEKSQPRRPQVKRKSSRSAKRSRSALKKRKR